MGTAVGYIVVGGMQGYAWLFEPWSGNRSMNRMVDQYTSFQEHVLLGTFVHQWRHRIAQNEFYA